MSENSIEIEREALKGNTKAAWEKLMEKVGVDYKDIPDNENLWFQTAGWSSSGKMLFVNDILPKEILERDDSLETKRLVAVLMAASSAYNFSDKDSPYQIAKCAESLEKAVTFVSPELRHKAYYHAADIYKRKVGISNDYAQNIRDNNKIKQGECLLKAIELSPNQSTANLYVGDYLREFTEGGCTYKSAYSPEALDKEIELYEKVLSKFADDKNLETSLHNELSKDYTCKANRTGNINERKILEEKANQHKTKIVVPRDHFKGGR